MFLKNVFFTLTCICLTVTLVCCSSGSREISSDYKEKVQVEVSLGPTSILNDITRDDIFFKVRNNGDKTITELMAEITFLYPDGGEAMRREWYLITTDKWMEKAVLERKAGQFRPIPSGGVVEFGELMSSFFIGKPEMREKARKEWDKLNAQIKVIMVETEPKG